MCSVKKVFLKILQTHRKIPVAVAFLAELQAEACKFIEKETLVQVFSCEFCEIFKKSFFIERLRWLLLDNMLSFFKVRLLTVASYPANI